MPLSTLLLPILTLSLLLISLLGPIFSLLLVSSIIPILRLLLSRRSLTIVGTRLRKVLRWGNSSLRRRRLR